MAEVGPPVGTVTFLFTDIEGSTRLWDEHPDAMGKALAKHDELCRTLIADCNGFIFSTGGDGFAVAFGRASDALTTAIDIQLGLQEESWPASVALRVRMGLHTGEAQERDGDYFGPPVNRAARIMAAGHGGQIVVSAVTAEVIGPMPGVEFIELGTQRLRGIVDPVSVLGVRADGLEWIDRALTTAMGAVGNLPTTVDDFVGRTDEVRYLATELHSRRLLSLTGVGGWARPGWRSRSPKWRPTSSPTGCGWWDWPRSPKPLRLSRPWPPRWPFATRWV
ncbi:MAG: adenylate/guanylate cyclase domain-containing protein [Acidimicrobiia bacterium]|nr:adenylate/guanylate cyclase domain-containing protein [Acidimicrobiia bacterium]